MERVEREVVWIASVGGAFHKGCVQFADPEAMVSRDPISKITVYHAGFIHGIRLWYGNDGARPGGMTRTGHPPTLCRG